MRIDRWFELNIRQDNWRTIMGKCLIHELPNGLQFYHIPTGGKSMFLVYKDMQILCRIYTNQNLDLFIEER